MSLRDFSGSSSGRMPILDRIAVVSSKMRPLERARVNFMELLFHALDVCAQLG